MQNPSNNKKPSWGQSNSKTGKPLTADKSTRERKPSVPRRSSILTENAPGGKVESKKTVGAGKLKVSSERMPPIAPPESKKTSKYDNDRPPSSKYDSQTEDYPHQKEPKIEQPPPALNKPREDQTSFMRALHSSKELKDSQLKAKELEQQLHKSQQELDLYKSIFASPEEKLDNNIEEEEKAKQFHKQRDLAIKKKLFTASKEKTCLKRLLTIQDNFSKYLESYSYEFSDLMKEVKMALAQPGSEEENLSVQLDRLFLAVNGLIGIEEKLLRYRNEYREFRNEAAYERKSQVDNEYDVLEENRAEKGMFDCVKDILDYEGCQVQKIRLCEEINEKIIIEDLYTSIVDNKDTYQQSQQDSKIKNYMIGGKFQSIQSGSQRDESECLLKRAFRGLSLLEEAPIKKQQFGKKKKGAESIKKIIEKESQNIYANLKRYDEVFKASRPMLDDKQNFLRSVEQNIETFVKIHENSSNENKQELPKRYGGGASKTDQKVLKDNHFINIETAAQSNMLKKLDANNTSQKKMLEDNDRNYQDKKMGLTILEDIRLLERKSNWLELYLTKLSVGEFQKNWSGVLENFVSGFLASVVPSLNEMFNFLDRVLDGTQQYDVYLKFKGGVMYNIGEFIEQKRKIEQRGVLDIPNIQMLNQLQEAAYQKWSSYNNFFDLG